MTVLAIRRQRGGFTLLEVLVTIAMLGFIATMALTSWHQHTVRAWRAEARSQMIAVMLELQQHAMATGSYAMDDGDQPAGRWPRWVPPPPATPHHRIRAGNCPGQDLRQCVELRAVPEQADSVCGTLILRTDGEWLAEIAPDAGPVPLPDAC